MNPIEQLRVKSGATLGYMDIGKGLPIVLIHGLFLDHTAFEDQIQALAVRVACHGNRYRMIAIDIHGHGASSELDGSMSLDEMAEDYFDLVRQLGIPKAIWCGVSLGGMTSLRIAIRHPEAVLGLLLLNTNASQGAGKKVPSFDGLNAPLTMRLLWQTRFLKTKVLQAGLFGRTTLETKPELQWIWVEKMRSISSKSMKNAIEAVLSADSILEQLSSIEVPTIIAGGDEDTALPISASQDLHDRIDNSTLVKILNCGHSTPVEQPAQVTQLLERLLLAVTRC
jgi:3-oxoadipate enol-lactonase